MLSDYHMIQFWCHSCHNSYLQNLDNSSYTCSRCQSELVEEITAQDPHPAAFRPQLASNSSHQERRRPFVIPSPQVSFVTNTVQYIRQMPDGNITVTERINFAPFAQVFQFVGIPQPDQGPPAASQNTINSLPVITGREVKGDCSICQETFKDDETVRRMPCKHDFHHDCIVKWLNLRNTCPTCRTSVDRRHSSQSSCI